MHTLFRKYLSFSFVALAYGRAASESDGSTVHSSTGDPLDAGLCDRIKKTIASDALALEEARQAHVGAIDARLHLLLPLALLGGGLFGALALQSAIATIFLIPLSGAFTAIVALGLAERRYRAVAKREMAAILAPFVSGFRHEAPPSDQVSRCEAWRIFPQISRIEFEDRMISGCKQDISISQARFSFGPGKNKSRKKSLNISAVVIEIGIQNLFVASTIVIVSRTAGITFRSAPVRRHKLQPFLTGDIDFDDRYLSFTSDKAVSETVLSQEVRAAFSALEKLSRASASEFLSNLPSSTGVRPYVVIQPGYTAIVLPLPRFDAAFEPGPLGRPIDPEEAAMQYTREVISRNQDIQAGLAFHLIASHRN